MTEEATKDVLLLGIADAGKSTLLTQIYGRLKSGGGRLRARSAPASLAPIQAGLARLEQGLAVEHTPKGTDVTQRLPAQTEAGDAWDINLPDYAGEELHALVRNRKVSERWRELASDSDRWLLLIRLTREAQLPDVLSKPIGTLARAPLPPSKDDLDALPIDLWAVELLQILLYARGDSTRTRRKGPSLALVLSCWDELDVADGTAPEELAQERLAVLHAYCRSNWESSAFAVYGLSAQGQALSKREPAEEYLDRGPQQMGWLVLPDGARDRDLTLLATQA